MKNGPKETMLPEAEAAVWAEELDGWALVREKVTAKLDVHMAKEARRLAREIRDVAREVKDARESNDVSTAGIMLEQLGSLRVRALSLLSGG